MKHADKMGHSQNIRIKEIRYLLETELFSMKLKSFVHFVLERRRIVWSLRGLMNCFCRWSQVCHAKNNILLYCHDVHRYVVLDGKLYSPLIDVVHENLGINSGVSCAAPFSKLTADKCYMDVKNYNFSILVGFLKRLFRNRSLILKSVEQDPVISAYSYVFKRIGCRVVVAVQPSIEMCIAANRLGIKIFDLQHGVISGTGYYSLERRRKFSQAGWPHGILCWDSVSRDRVERESVGYTKAILTGHPAYVTDEGKRLLNSPLTRDARESSFSFVVLISLTWHDFGQKFEDPIYEVFGIPSELVQLIQRMRNIFFRIRLHPVQNRYSRRQLIAELERLFADQTNVNFRDYNDCYVGGAFSGCAGHITVASATSIEALQLGIKTLLVEGYNPLRFEVVRDYFGDYIDSDAMVQLHRYELSSMTEAELQKLFYFTGEDVIETGSHDGHQDTFQDVLINCVSKC